MPIYITVDPDSPASSVYHDHSYFIRHESTNTSIDNIQRRKSSMPINHTQSQVQQEKSSLPSVEILNQLFLEHQKKAKTSQSSSSPASTPLDFTAILRALLVKQGQHLPSHETSSPAAS